MKEHGLRFEFRVTPKDTPSPDGQLPLTPNLKKALELALREALSMGHNYIGTEHLLLGIGRMLESRPGDLSALCEGTITYADIQEKVVAKLTRSKPKVSGKMPFRPESILNEDDVALLRLCIDTMIVLNADQIESLKNLAEKLAGTGG